MGLVYFKCTYDILGMPDFFEKLKEFVGHFRIEPQQVDDSYRGIVTISFFTDKVEVKEGEYAQVDLEINRDSFWKWNFSGINKG